jgi:hypothetical protein
MGNSSLPTMTRLGIREVEAGTQGAIRHQLQVTLALTGSLHGETEPRKATQMRAVATLITDFARVMYPADPLYRKQLESGVLAVELATPKETNQSNERNEKKRF